MFGTFLIHKIFLLGFTNVEDLFCFSVVIQHNCQVHRDADIKTTTNCMALVRL